MTGAGAASLTATNTSTIHATIVAASVAVGGGGAAGVGVSIGAAVARNLIGYGLDGSYTPTQVQAYLLNSSLTAAGALTLTANSSQTINATVVAASMALAGGGRVGVAASGSGVSATNQMGAQVEAYINGTGAAGVTAASASLSAQDSSTINANAGAASVAASFGGNGGVSLSIAVSLAENTIANVVDAAIKNAANLVTTTGAVGLNAVENASITATSTAASLAAGIGGQAGIAVSGAGAEATNVILTKVNAHIDYSNIASAGAVNLSASNTSTINATITGASAAIGGGGAAGVGVSIGVAMAQNLLGFTLNGSSSPAEVQAYLLNSSLNAAGALTLTANSSQTINATVVAASAAVAAGGVAGVGGSGAGASTNNTIATNIKAYIDGSGATGIRAASASLSAQDTSSITANTGAASLAASFAGTAAVSLSIGVALAQNTIANVVDAAIKNAANGVSTTAGPVALNATENATIKAFSVAASASAAVAGIAGIALSGAGANSTNIILNQTNAHVDNSILTSATSVQLTAADSSSINASILATSASVGGGGIAGVGASIGASVANNYIGWINSSTPQAAQVQAYIENSRVTAVGALGLSASSTATINASVLSGSVALAGGAAAGVGVSGAGSSTVNKVRTLIQSYIDGTSTTTSTGSVSLSATDASTITATAGSASLAASFGAAGVSVSVGLSLADNEISNQIAAYISNTLPLSVNTTSGDITLTATDQATITAASKAASAAVGAGFAGVSFSGAGANADNVILTTTNAYVINSQLNSAGNVSLTATDTSTLTAHVYALSAAAGGGAVGVGVAIGSSTAQNLIGQTLSGTSQPAQVQAYIESSKLTAGGALSLSATESATINAGIDSIASAIGGGAVGIAASGAGVNAQNLIATQVQAYIDGSPNIQTKSGLNISAQDTSTITANGLAASVAASFGLISGSVSISVALANNTIANTVAAFVNGSTVTTTGGSAALQAVENATISSTTSAAAASAGFGLSLAGGGANATATVLDATKATIDKSTLNLAGTLNLTSTSTSTATANVGVTSVSLGFIAAAAAGSVANVVINPSVDTHIVNSTVSVSGNIGLQSQAVIQPSAATSNGVSASTGVSVGGATATVTATPTITSTMDSSTVKSLSGSISMSSLYNSTGITATAYAASGGLIAGNGTNATVTATPTLKTSATSTAALSAYQDINLSAQSVNTATSSATGAAGGLVGIGASISNSTASSNVSAYFNGQGKAGRNANLTALSADTAETQAQGVSGGLLAGSYNHSTGTVTSNVQAYLGSSSGFSVANNFTIAATATPEGDASTQGYGGGVLNASDSVATVNITPTANAYIGSGASVNQQNSAGTISVTAIVTPQTPASNAAPPNGIITAVNASAGTVTAQNNLATGSTVQYSNGGSGAVDSSGLQDGRIYSAIATGTNTLEFGGLFGSAGVSADGTITFNFADNFQNGDQVVFHANGGSVVGLTDGATYYVSVVSTTSIRLESQDQYNNPQNYLKTFTANAVNATPNTITLANTFSNGQAVTYHVTVPSQQFGSSVVNISVDSNGNPVVGSNNQPTDVPGANNIFIQNNPYHVGDKLAYTVSGGPVIAGLVSGNTYTVKTVNGNLITLADSAGNTVTLSPDKSTAGKAATQTFTLLGIGGLQDGTTYYVINRTAASFQLAATPSGTALNLSATGVGTSTQFSIGSDHIYLGAASGTQMALTIKLGSLPTAGTPTLLGPGGVPLASLAQAPGDGVSSVSSKGAGGGLFSTFGNQASVTENPTVSAYLDSAVKLNAAGNVSITTQSMTSTNASAQNGSGGFIAFGDAGALSSVTSSNQVYVGSNAQLTVGGNLTLSTNAGSNQGTVSASTNAGGAVADVTSTASDTTNFGATTAEIKSGSTVTVGGKLLISANNSASGATNAYGNAIGLGGLGAGNSSNTVNGTAQVLLDSNTTVTANTVSLQATAGNSNLSSNAGSFGAGIYGQAESTSNLTANLTNNITLASGAKLTGTSGVDVLGYFSNLSTRSSSNAKAGGLFAYAASTSGNNTTLNSTITASSGSLVTAGPRGTTNTNLSQLPSLNQLGLYVNNNSLDSNINVSNNRSRSSIGLFAFTGGSDNGSNSANSSRTINWSGNLYILGPQAQLTVNANGSLNPNIDVPFTQSGNTITVSNITNIPTTVQTAFSSGTVTGSGGTWTYRDAFQSVTIINSSALTVNVQGVNLSNVVANPSATPPVIQVSGSSSLQKTIAYDTTPGGVITLKNLGSGQLNETGTVTTPTPPSTPTTGGTGTGTTTPATQDQVFHVGTQTTILFTLTTRNTTSKYEIGVFQVDNASGAIGSLLPGSAGYLQAALARAKTVYNANSTLNSTATVTLTAGGYYGFYLIVNPTGTTPVGTPPSSIVASGYTMNNVFFSFQAANLGGVDKMNGIVGSSGLNLGWNNKGAAFNDVVITAQGFDLSGQYVGIPPSTAAMMPTLGVPGSNATAGVVASSAVQSSSQSLGNNGNDPTLASASLGGQSSVASPQTQLFDEQLGHFVPSSAVQNIQADNFALYINLEQNATRQSLFELHEDDSASNIGEQADTNKHLPVKAAKPAVRINWTGYNG